MPRPPFGSLRLMLAPLVRRKSRALLSLAALALGACLVTALFTLYRGVQRNLGHQFRRYGANLVVTPAPGVLLLPRSQVQPVLAQFPASVGVLYDVGQSAGQSVVIAGADLARLRQLNSEWQIQGSGALPQAGQAWLGVNAARLLHRRIGDQIELSIEGRPASWRVVGTIQAGTSEDNQVLAPYPQVAALARRSGYTTLQLRVPAGAAMPAAIARLLQLLPGAQPQPVRQIAAGEGAILLSTRSMLLATTALILFTVGLCVAAALTTLALERRRDFALMKALGGSDLSVMAAFVGEAALLALLASVVGILLGALLAGLMGRALFGLWLLPSLAAAALGLVLTLALATLAALLPWPIVRAAAPAAILRGE
ncbi:MAG TPA: ABC transporter permease [Terriglobales bacterium]|nr:ABC transporter permease [Terriglobales bacterium]